jgi:hypothetical protein
MNTSAPEWKDMADGVSWEISLGTRSTKRPKSNGMANRF